MATPAPASPPLAAQTSSEPPALVPFDFGEAPPTELVSCSEQYCTKGHVWHPTLAVAKCPGCQAPLLVLKMVNCPICNEPVAGVRMRLDHLAKGGAVTPVCKGSASLAEVLMIEISHNHASDTEVTHQPKEVETKV